TVGSSRRCSSPTSARAIASRIAAEGFVCVSERRSITDQRVRRARLEAVKNALLVLVLLLAPAVAAQAAAPFVPAGTKSQLRILLKQFDVPDLGYIPTRGPAHYVFIGFTVNQASTNFRLADARHPASGPGQ